MMSEAIYYSKNKAQIFSRYVVGVERTSHRQGAKREELRLREMMMMIRHWEGIHNGNLNGMNYRCIMMCPGEP
jgi:hypothetical protein